MAVGGASRRVIRVRVGGEDEIVVPGWLARLVGLDEEALVEARPGEALLKPAHGGRGVSVFREAARARKLARLPLRVLEEWAEEDWVEVEEEA